MITRDALAALDAADPLAPMRAQFHLPDGVVYLDQDPAGPLVARLPGGGRCNLQFQVPDALRADATVAQIDATCDADSHPN